MLAWSIAEMNRMHNLLANGPNSIAQSQRHGWGAAVQRPVEPFHVGSATMSCFIVPYLIFMRYRVLSVRPMGAELSMEK